LTSTYSAWLNPFFISRVDEWVLEMVASDDVRSHTAIHVLKGAVVHVLGRGAKWSASAYSQGTHGGLTVQFDRKPSDEEMQRIEEAANQKIREDILTEVHELARGDAEVRWGDDIYDLFPSRRAQGRQGIPPPRLERQHLCEATLRQNWGGRQHQDWRSGDTAPTSNS